MVSCFILGTENDEDRDHLRVLMFAIVAVRWRSIVPDMRRWMRMTSQYSICRVGDWVKFAEQRRDVFASSCRIYQSCCWIQNWLESVELSCWKIG
jgi:hypothetical protein